MPYLYSNDAKIAVNHFRKAGRSAYQFAKKVVGMREEGWQSRRHYYVRIGINQLSKMSKIGLP